MKRGILLHAELSGLIAAMGHGDLLIIGDAGLPVPPNVRCIDLAVTRGIPRFIDVLDAVLSELIVERSAVAHEAGTGLIDALSHKPLGSIERLTHEELKQASRSARAIIRTGECTPYANICLWSGVAF